MTTLYKYIGAGGYLPNVPARDITTADVEERVELWLENGIDEKTLLASGLYQKVEQPASKKTKAGKEGE